MEPLEENKPRNFKSDFERITNSTEEELKRWQLDKYRRLTTRVFGENNDPFEVLTGYKLENEYMKSRSMPVFIQFDNNQYRHWRSYNDVFAFDTKVTAARMVNKLIYFDNKVKAEVSLFDPVNLVGNHIINFGLVDTYVGDSGILFRQGVLVLDNDMVDLLSRVDKESREKIASSLHEISSLFNHDGVAHGTFLPQGREEGGLMLDNEGRELNESFQHVPGEMRRGYGVHAFAGEIWSAQLHRDLFKLAIDTKPSVKRLLVVKFRQFIDVVNKASEGLEKAKRNDFIKYYLMVYSFCFFRIISPSQITSDEGLKKIVDQYPFVLDDMSSSEKEFLEVVHERETGVPDISSDNVYTSREIFRIRNKLTL